MNPILNRPKAAIFDLDGTVVLNAYNWPAIRKALGSGEASILAWLKGLPKSERLRKTALLEGFEAEQTTRSELREGMDGFIPALRAMGVRPVLVTNNTRRNAEFLLARFGLAFDLVMTRESGLWKPSGDPFREVMRLFGLQAGECCVVGDSGYDLAAALDAGIPTVFLLSEHPELFAGTAAEVFLSVAELRRRIEAMPA